jgi:hypothetical protein
LIPHSAAIVLLPGSKPSVKTLGGRSQPPKLFIFQRSSFNFHRVGQMTNEH